MGLLFDLWDDLNKGRKYKKKHHNDRLGWNLYDPGKTLKEHQKRWYFIHYVWKYKVFLPMIRILSKILGKHLQRTVPDEPHNINIRLFHESVEEALNTWTYQYMKIAYQKNRSDDWCEKFLQNYACKAIRDGRDLLTTVLLYDSAYRELFNILAHTFTKKMAEHHSAAGTRDKTGHLLFTKDDVYDPDYYMLFKKVEQQRYMALHNVDQESYSRERFELQERLKNNKI